MSAPSHGRLVAGLLLLEAVDLALPVACAAFGPAIGLTVGWALAGHAVIATISVALWLRWGASRGFAAAMLGVLGPIGILATLPLDRASWAVSPRSDDAMFGPRARHSAHRGAGLKVARMLDGRVHHATPDTVSSLVTIMRHGDVAARRRALETVVRSFEPALSPLIALALTDGDQTIRALAAAASARVAENLVLARARLTTRIADESDPEATTTLVALLADHARGDVLLSDSQRAHLREDAVTLRGAAAAAGDDAGTVVQIEALWAVGDYAAIDRLTAAGDDAMATWWRAEAAA
jgi:hypothetical protein